MTIDVTTNTINFEEDQQDAMKRTDNIQSLADQVERLEECDKSIENMEAKLKNLKKSRDVISDTIEHATPINAGSPVSKR